MSRRSPKRQRTARWSKSSVNWAALGLQTSADLDELAIASWIKAYANNPERGPARAESLLRCIRVIANYAVRKGYLDVSPFVIRPLKRWVSSLNPRPRPRRLLHKTRDEIARLLRVADRRAAAGDWRAGRTRALVYVYVYTGLRSEEARRIVAANVHLDRRIIVIEPVDGWSAKTQKSAERVIPIADPLAAVLADWKPRCGSKYLFPGWRRKSFSRGRKTIDRSTTSANWPRRLASGT